MKFAERLNFGHRDKEYKNHLPLILSIIAGALLIAAIVIFFLFFNPFSHANSSANNGGDGEIVLYSAQNEWLANTQQPTADNKVWIESNGLKISSATLYGEDDKSVAQFSEDAENNMKFYTLLNVPLDKAQELKYYAKCKCNNSKEVITNTITIKVVDSFPDAYFDSESRTDEKLAEMMSSDEYKKLSTEEKSKEVIERLNEYAGQNPENGEAYVNKNSIEYNEDTQSVFFVEAAGTYCYVDLKEYEEGVSAGTQKSDVTVSAPHFDGRYKDEVNGNVILMSALFDSEEDNEVYYSQLCDAIESETSLNLKYEKATLDNLRNDLGGNDFIIIECHGYLDEFYGLTVPMISPYGYAKNEPITNELKADLAGHRVCKKYLMQNDVASYRYVLTPLFFSYYYGETGLKNSIVHLGSCEGFGDDLSNQNGYMSSSFISSGAKAVIGHINSVYTYYDRTLISEELDSLLDDKTIGEALNDAEEKYGSNDKDFMLKYGGSELKSAVLNHIAAYNDIHGDSSARLSDIIPKQPSTVPPETQPATEKPGSAKKVNLEEYVSETPYMFDEKNNGANNNLKLYIIKADDDEFTFRINDKKGYLNFTNRIIAPLESDNTANFIFKDSIGREYAARMEFTGGRVYLRVTHNSSDMTGTFTLDSEGWMSKSDE